MKRRELSEALKRERVPEASAAEERARAEVMRAYATTPLVKPRRRARMFAVPALAAGAVAALALTPAGASVVDWIEEVVEPEPGVVEAAPALTALPSAGSLLVESPEGVWVVQEDGSRRLLGEYEDGTWSPHGLHVAVTSGRTLTAVVPDGEIRWSLSASRPISFPAWAPSGYRIAYLSGDDLRVVRGDGVLDHLLERAVTHISPVWEPFPENPTFDEEQTGAGTHRIAYVNAEGRVVFADADSGERLWVEPGSARRGPVHALAWRAPGHLLIAREGLLEEVVLTAQGPDQLSASPGPFQLALDAPPRALAVAPDGERIAIASSSSPALPTEGGDPRGGASELLLVRLDAGAVASEVVLSGPGRLSALSWAPDSDWLVVAWPDADQWVFLRLEAGVKALRTVKATAGIAAEFAPGERRHRGFPVPAGWCCPD